MLLRIFVLTLSLAFGASAFAENPIVDRYYDRSLPTYLFQTLTTDSRYTDPAFIPTNLSSIEDAQKLMVELKYYRKSYAECYQRAHLWSLEMRQMAKVNSQKVFLFFTDKYIRENSFKWWFHVAPFVLVNGKEMVLDPYFFDQPVDLQTWSDHFMPKHPKCRLADSYQDYEDHNQDEDCIYRKMPMYYYAPNDIEMRDKKNEVVSDWIDYSVIAAYKSLLPWWRR